VAFRCCSAGKIRTLCAASKPLVVLNFFFAPHLGKSARLSFLFAERKRVVTYYFMGIQKGGSNVYIVESAKLLSSFVSFGMLTGIVWPLRYSSFFCCRGGWHGFGYR
jgi:hypothetical protein